MQVAQRGVQLLFEIEIELLRKYPVVNAQIEGGNAHVRGLAGHILATEEHGQPHPGGKWQGEQLGVSCFQLLRTDIGGGAVAWGREVLGQLFLKVSPVLAERQIIGSDHRCFVAHLSPAGIAGLLVLLGGSPVAVRVFNFECIGLLTCHSHHRSIKNMPAGAVV